MIDWLMSLMAAFAIGLRWSFLILLAVELQIVIWLIRLIQGE